MHAVADFHDVAAAGGRLNAYGREAEPETGCVMGWSVNNIMLGVVLEIILEGVSGV